MQGKWQEALDSWPKWKKSIETARASIKNKYGNVANLIDGAKFEYEEKDKGSSGKSLEFSVNNAQWKKWEIETELESAASDFIKREIGLLLNTDLHDVFVSIWISSISPLFRRDVMIEHEIQQEIVLDVESKDNPLSIQLESKTRRKDNRVINSVSWYHDGVSHREVAEFLQKIEWPFDEERARRHGGGRPSQEDKEDIEAIICYVLRYLKKPKLKEGETAKLLGWHTHKNDYDQLVSRTVRKRLKRGRQIMKEINLKKMAHN